MAERITFVVEYPSTETIPPISSGMEAAGGRVVTVAFEDALDQEQDSGEVMRLHGALNALLAHARFGSAEEQIIATALNTTPEKLRAEHNARLIAQ
jgi:hypothetical protein